MSATEGEREEIAALKKRINEIAFAPLEDHGALFEAVNQELNQALNAVEGISANVSNIGVDKDTGNS